jgi:plastocyanin
MVLPKQAESTRAMRKLLAALLAGATLATAGAVADSARSAATATQTVKITSAGYVPASVSITTGDSVAFTNSDKVAHTVQFKTTTGMHCSVALPLVLQPAQSASCTFSATGKFTFSDPASKGKKFRGTVTVAPALTSTLTLAPTAVVYGRKVTLGGKLSSQQAGQSLQILAQQCGASTSTRLANVTTTTGGAFSYAVQPLKQTAYTVKLQNVTSTAVTGKVKPRLQLSRVARHRFVVHVFAAQTFAGKYATFQRYRRAARRWQTVKRVLLQANETGVAPTVITSANFRSSIRARLQVRVLLGQMQVGSCYLAGRSNTIRS